MAKSLKDYKRKEYKAVVIEDFVNGGVKTVYNQEAIQKALKEYSELEVTKIYSPTEQQRSKILDMVIAQTDEENGKVKAKMADVDIVLTIIPMLTDMDVNGTEDEEILREVIKNPDDVMISVSNVINHILLEITANYFSTLKVAGNLPADYLDALVKTTTNKKDNKKK